MKFTKGIVLGALLAMPVVGFAEEVVTNAYWKSNLSLGATAKSGNTEKSLFTANIKADRFGKHNDVINSLYAEYGKTEGDQTEGQVRGQSEYRHKFGGTKFFAGAFGEAVTDSIKQIRARAKAGPTIGYYFIDKKNMKLDATFGLNYVYERTAVEERTYGEYRAAGNFKWEITEQSSYYLSIEYTANMEDTDLDNQGLLVTGVRSKINADLSLFVELRDEYDNLPDSGNDHNDSTIMAGLSYDF